MVSLKMDNYYTRNAHPLEKQLSKAKTTTEVNQIVINVNCIPQPVKRRGLLLE